MAELSIKIKIGNREYPMHVKEEDEERIRNAGRLLNEKMKEYQNKFEIKEAESLIAMVAFDCMVDKLKREESSDASDNFALSEVAKLNQLISDSIWSDRLFDCPIVQQQNKHNGHHNNYYCKFTDNPDNWIISRPILARQECQQENQRNGRTKSTDP